MNYLKAEDILLAHSLILDETGGLHGIRDLGSIAGVVDSVKHSFGGVEVYPSIFDKAAVYACFIIRHHPFLDGNKRSAMTTASLLLELNNYQLSVKEGAIEEFALKIIH